MSSSYLPVIIGTVNQNNSSSTILTANSVFTGTATDVSLYASIAISVVSDQSSANSGLSIQFSSDGTNWDLKKQYTLVANAIQNHIFSALSKYFRIVYTNGTTNQTFFRLQVVLHPSNKSLVNITSDVIPYASSDCTTTNAILNGITTNTELVLPCTVNEQGVLNVVLKNPSSAFGDTRIIEPTPVVQIDFTYGNNATTTIGTTTGSGAVTNASSMAVMSTTAATNSSAMLTSRYFARYKAGQSGLIRLTAIFTTGIAGNTQIAGAGTSADGYFFGYNGTSFGILYRSSATGSLVNTWIPQTSWNMDVMNGASGSPNPSGVNLAPSNGNVYQISYSYLGFGNIYFYILSPFDTFVLVHVIQYSNSNTSTIVSNPNIQLLWQSLNTTNNTNIVVKAGSGAIFVEGRERFLGPKWAFDVNSITIRTTAIPVFSIKNIPTFNSITNTSQIKLLYLSISCNNSSTTDTFLIRLTLNATLTGATFLATLNTINSGNSIATIDTAATAITALSGTQMFSKTLGPGDTYNINLTNCNINMIPGDVITISAIGNVFAGNQIATSLFWQEDI